MIIIICVIFGTVFAIFAQGFAYDFNDIFPQVHPITFLTIFTIISYLLYGIGVAITFYKIIKHNMEVKYLEILVVVIIISLIMSCWSTFVLAMWWG